jgi:hypothetical protein
MITLTLITINVDLYLILVNIFFYRKALLGWADSIRRKRPASRRDTKWLRTFTKGSRESSMM